jgi:hypothetical protein
VKTNGIYGRIAVYTVCYDNCVTVGKFTDGWKYSKEGGLVFIMHGLAGSDCVRCFGGTNQVGQPIRGNRRISWEVGPLSPRHGASSGCG